MTWPARATGAPVRSADHGEVEGGGQQRRGGDLRGQLGGHAGLLQPRRALGVGRGLAAQQPARQPGPHRGDGAANRSRTSAIDGAGSSASSGWRSSQRAVRSASRVASVRSSTWVVAETTLSSGRTASHSRSTSKTARATACARPPGPAGHAGLLDQPEQAR